MAEPLNPLALLLGYRESDQRRASAQAADAARIENQNIARQQMQYGREDAANRLQQAMATGQRQDARAERELQGRMQIARENRAAAAARSRGSGRPVLITGPDGKPQWARPEEAIGKQGWSTKTQVELPVQALKVQDELLDDLSLTSGLQSNLGALVGQIDSGSLKLGPVSNTLNRVKTSLGFGDAESQNYESFRATLEKMRNDSLRLNKGVQTEGDAIRAWDELVKSINDPGTVRQRLEQIRDYNQQATMTKAQRIKMLRQNFGAGDIDLSPFVNRQPTVGRDPGPRAKFLGFEGQP